MTFSTGLAIFYKPKSLRPDLAFYEFLAQLTSLCEEPPPLCPRTIDRGSYGWAQEFTPSPCTNDDEVRGFYRAAGRLLCAEYVLGGSDVHFDNLIAAGMHPVVIDDECLVTNLPGGPGEPVTATRQAQLDYFPNSVMRVGMLPEWTSAAGGTACDYSALGRTMPAAFAHIPLKIKFPNSDVMRFHREVTPRRAANNAPFLEDASINPELFVSDIVADFARAYRACSTALLLADQQLHKPSTLTTRHVFPATSVYAQHLVRLQSPSSLRYGVSAQIALETLYRTVLLDPESVERLRPLIARKSAELLRLDVPIFHVAATQTEILLGAGGAAPGVFGASAMDALATRCGRLGEADLERQIN